MFSKQLQPEEISERLKKKSQKAEAYLRAKGFDVQQINGQRVSTRSDWNDNPDLDAKEVKNEIYIGLLPRDLFEDELLPVFETCGKINKIRLMTDFSGSTRGFGYIRYETEGEAQSAHQRFNGANLRFHSKPIMVLISTDNRRLFVGNLPFHVTKDDIFRELRNYISDTMPVDIEMPPMAPSHRNYRFVFIVFKNHTAATVARRVLIPSTVLLFGKEVNIDWARPASFKKTKTCNGTISNNRTSDKNRQPNSSETHPRNTAQPLTFAPAADDLLVDLNNNSCSEVNRLPPSVLEPVINLLDSYVPQQPLTRINKPTWLTSNQILGQRAAMMMDAPLPQNIDSHSPMSIVEHAENIYDEKRTITFCNLDLDMFKTSIYLKVFSLCGLLNIASIHSDRKSTITVIYATAEEAQLMLEATNRHPESFALMQSKGGQIVGYRGLSVLHPEMV